MRRPAAFALLMTVGPCVVIPSDAVAQAAPTSPQSCRTLWEGIGLPARTGGGHLTTVCHLGYITGHNDRNKTPDWVIEHLTPNLTDGEATREDQDFHADPALPEAASAQPADYEKSDFDQGHQAPAADFKGKQDFLDDTFFLSNAVPQVGPGFNRSIWRSLETHVRKLVGGGRKELYVITGPIPQSSPPTRISSRSDVCGANLTLPVPEKKSICPENREDKEARCSAGVAVPAALFKIVYDTAAGSAFAILMENKSHTGLYPSGRTFDYIKAHRIGIGTIEDVTGLTFFTRLTERKRRQMRASCTDVKFH
jgi:DNA/RNA endonuclease G (NUC1)